MPVDDTLRLLLSLPDAVTEPDPVDDSLRLLLLLSDALTLLLPLDDTLTVPDADADADADAVQDPVTDAVSDAVNDPDDDTLNDDDAVPVDDTLRLLLSLPGTPSLSPTPSTTHCDTLLLLSDAAAATGRHTHCTRR